MSAEHTVHTSKITLTLIGGPTVLIASEERPLPNGDTLLTVVRPHRSRNGRFKLFADNPFWLRML